MKKYICTPLLNSVMYAHLSLFERKQIYVINGPLPNFNEPCINCMDCFTKTLLSRHMCVFKKKQVISRVLVHLLK